MSVEQDLKSELKKFEEELLRATALEDDSQRVRWFSELGRLKQLGQKIETAQRRNQLSPECYRMALYMLRRSATVANTLADWRQRMDDAEDIFDTECSSIVNGRGDPHYPATGGKAGDATRDAYVSCKTWYLEHMWDPHPSVATLRTLARACRVHPSEIESWFARERALNGFKEIEVISQAAGVSPARLFAESDAAGRQALSRYVALVKAKYRPSPFDDSSVGYCSISSPKAPIPPVVEGRTSANRVYDEPASRSMRSSSPANTTCSADSLSQRSGSVLSRGHGSERRTSISGSKGALVGAPSPPSSPLYAGSDRASRYDSMSPSSASSPTSTGYGSRRSSSPAPSSFNGASMRCPSPGPNSRVYGARPVGGSGLYGTSRQGSAMLQTRIPDDAKDFRGSSRW